MRFPLESLRRWKAQLWHLPWEAELEQSLQLEVAFQQLVQEVEDGLRDIDFDDVTTDDRIAFVEAAVAWQVRRTLARGRFDLALRIQRYGAERVAQLYERVHGWRPSLLYGVPSPPARDVGRGR
jgi:hypothetical protein